MHSFEQIMVSALESGTHPFLEMFGGPPGLLEVADTLALSPLMPAFLELVCEALPSATAEVREDLCEFVCQCIEKTTYDFTLIKAVDIVDQISPLLENKNDRCFNRFLDLSDNRKIAPMSRAAALDGALRWAANDRRRQLRLMSHLLGVEKNDDSIYLARAAKVIGVAYSHWRESGLKDKLRDLTEVDGAADEASFEMGMARLVDGVDSKTRKEANEALEAARYWFSRSEVDREERPDANLYRQCVETILSFSREEPAVHINDLAEGLSQNAFALKAWHSSSNVPIWLGARFAEVVQWELMIIKLQKLATSLDEPSWWEPAVVVEEYLISAYTASRSILRRGVDGGVEELVRPRIEATLAKSDGQFYALKQWATRHIDEKWAEQAKELIQRVDAVITSGVTSNPTEAATARPSIAALLELASIPRVINFAAQKAVANALTVHLANMSGAEMSIIESILGKVARCSEYNENVSGKKLFDAVLVWSVRFLNNRLEITQGTNPRISYLFERDGGTLPAESELQSDFFEFAFGLMAGTEIEVNNVGSGRADLRFTFGGERLVTEVKRELRDSSFPSLVKAYAAQATDYQNVSIRLGFLLVLDLTEIRSEGTPHISTLVGVEEVVRKGENEPRIVVIIKVPGRRLRPSDLTKDAVRNGKKVK
ncbi:MULTISPECIES: hypothetical protein [Geobacteraceae]|uniref:Protein NO VEIN C-terminal domain-containing protein n=1 Tax=Geotalea uraniireducens TaxID=351604 RepID=A0ABN6VQQ8_9BACT|nr:MULTISPECIES: hypothetical protein [Geobacteraceae]BDV42679.1 hypothetical protein GURASL_16020 [Geotalea uraniireducens]HML78993.1 hypothetical protein [Geobacter sulfurreducens]